MRSSSCSACVDWPTADPEMARGGDGQIVLADVDVVGLAQLREVGTVVHDERHAEPACQLAHALEHVQQRAVRERPLADLDDVDAAADRRLEELVEIGTIAA